MSNKNWERLSEIDRRLRTIFKSGLDSDHIMVTIEMINEFEAFNTRPYHNYENWGDGYRIRTGPKFGNIMVEAEDLDDAITALEQQIKKLKTSNGKPI